MIGAIVKGLFGGVTEAIGGARWWVFAIVAVLAGAAGGCAGVKLGAVNERGKWAEPFKAIASELNAARKDAEARAEAAAEAANAAIANAQKAVELAKEKNLKAEQDQQRIINAIWSTRNAIRDLESATRDIAVGTCSFSPDADRLLKRAHEAASSAAGGSVPPARTSGGEASRPYDTAGTGAGTEAAARPRAGEAGGKRDPELSRFVRVSRDCFVAEAGPC